MGRSFAIPYTQNRLTSAYHYYKPLGRHLSTYLLYSFYWLSQTLDRRLRVKSPGPFLHTGARCHFHLQTLSDIYTGCANG